MAAVYLLDRKTSLSTHALLFLTCDSAACPGKCIVLHPFLMESSCVSGPGSVYYAHSAVDCQIVDSIAASHVPARFFALFLAADFRKEIPVDDACVFKRQRPLCFTRLCGNSTMTTDGKL